jgi:uncharacterized protein YdhG (YjbR/CyaY superfamily)
VPEPSLNRDAYFPAIEKKHGLPMSYWFDQIEKISDRKYAEQIAFLREEHGFSQVHANALVLYCRGSKSAKKFGTVDEYFAQFDEEKIATAKGIFKVLMDHVPKAELVLAWNTPMLKLQDQYIFALSIHTKHILLAPWGDGVIDKFKQRLSKYETNKKTFKVPVDWEIDAKLLQDLISARVTQAQA